MSFIKRLQITNNMGTMEAQISAYVDRSFEISLLPEVIQAFAKKYVDENFDELLKQVDMEAFKQQITLALAVQAAIKVNQI